MMEEEKSLEQLHCYNSSWECFLLTSVLCFARLLPTLTNMGSSLIHTDFPHLWHDYRFLSYMNDAVFFIAAGRT